MKKKKKEQKKKEDKSDNQKMKMVLIVFSKSEQHRGIAINKSIGDFLASNLGIICLPEIKEEKIDDTCIYVALASDRVWDLLTMKKLLII